MILKILKIDFDIIKHQKTNFSKLQKQNIHKN